jgi:RNA polymerase sigma-70 factor (ECF subfamily)
MQVLVRQLPRFERQRNGSFCRWLRTITVHRVQAHYRARQGRPQALGVPLEESPLAQLNDPRSELSLLWDEEHDRHVLRRLLELVEPLFEAKTMAAFRRVVFEEAPPAQVAEELGLSVSAVYLAKSHMLKSLREEAKGLID